VDESVPSLIYSDPNRIRQIILNLVENAIKYNTQNGSVSVTLLRENNFLKIIVNDTGNGMSPHKLKTLFNTDFNSGERMSVSLPIAYKLAKILGGDLKVDSQLCVGSTFTLSIFLNPIPTGKESITRLEQCFPECDVEEECHVIPNIQRPRAFVSTRNFLTSSFKLVYEFNKLIRTDNAEMASDSHMKRYNINGTVAGRFPQTKNEFIQAKKKDFNTGRLKTYRTAISSDNNNLGDVMANIMNRNLNRRSSAFKYEHEFLTCRKPEKQPSENPPLFAVKKINSQEGFNKIQADTIRRNFLKMHSVEKTKSGNLSNISLNNAVTHNFESNHQLEKFDHNKRTPSARYSCIFHKQLKFQKVTSQEEILGKKEDSAAKLEKLKFNCQEIARRLNTDRCQKCADFLIVDDNEFNRYLLIQVLSKYGFISHTVFL